MSAAPLPPPSRPPDAASDFVPDPGPASDPARHPAIGRIEAALSALGAVARNPGLAWLLLSWALSTAGSWIFVVAAFVVAYRSAGPAGVGAVGLARMLPSALAAPFVLVLERRFAGQRLLVAIHSFRIAAALLIAAGLVAGVPLVLLLVLVGIKAVAGVFVRPTLFGLVPQLATEPGEVVAANVGASTGEGIGTLTGPILGGLLVAAAGPVAAAAVSAAVLGGALLCAALVRVNHDAVVRSAAVSPLRAVQVGLASLREHPGARLIVACFVAQVVIRGALSVLIVVASIELLGLGDSGVGLLNAAIGLGGLAGALVALGVAGVRRLSVPFALALVGWGVPIMVIGAVPSPVVAALVLVVLGASNATLDVAGFTLLQRLIPNAQRTAVFGLLEGVASLGVALGSILAPVILHATTTRVALVLVGGFLPVVALLAWRRLAHVDQEAVVPERELRLLRALPIFAPLPMTVIERVAGQLVRVRFAAGEAFIRQGDLADCFYAIEDGEVEIVRDGRVLRTSGRGAAVGEIGLLRRVPRTATVRATAPTTAYALGGDAFIAAVTGNPRSESVADAVIADRLSFAPAEPTFATDASLDDAAAREETAATG